MELHATLQKIRFFDKNEKKTKKHDVFQTISVNFHDHPTITLGGVAFGANAPPALAYYQFLHELTFDP